MPDAPHFVERSVRIYRSLMHVYPVSFRKRYGCEMIRVFREMATDATQQYGSAGLISTWCRVLGDLVLSAFAEHLVELQGRCAMKTAPGWIVKLLAILNVACFWGIPFSPILAIAAVSTTKETSGWPRKLAVAGAVLCTLYTLLLAALLFSAIFISCLHGSWSF